MDRKFSIMTRFLHALKRFYCRTLHTSPSDIQGRWTKTYTCRRCGLEFENSALDGPVKQLPATQSVRQVENPEMARKRAVWYG